MIRRFLLGREIFTVLIGNLRKLEVQLFSFSVYKVFHRIHWSKDGLDRLVVKDLRHGDHRQIRALGICTRLSSGREPYSNL